MIGILERVIDLKFRALFLSIVFSLASPPAWACSCAPWEGYVSEFTEDYVSFWGVPVTAAVDLSADVSIGELVVYEVDVLEDFGRLSKSLIRVEAIAPDRGNCGTALNIGVPQFISAFEDDNGNLAIAGCTPKLPYKAMKAFLETKKDICISSENSWFFMAREPDEQNPDCMVWNTRSYYQHSPEEEHDRRKYLTKWNRDK